MSAENMSGIPCDRWSGVNSPPSLHAAGLNQGLTFGGPVMCMWGWCVASIGCLCVALGMCELVSAYPTSGDRETA